MTPSNSLSVDNILRFLQLNREGASLYELQRGLKLRKTDQRPLTRILAKLKKRKAIAELSDGRFVLSRRQEAPQTSSNQNQQTKPPRPDQPVHARNALSGRLILHQDGYGFVVPDKPIPQLDRDVFIPRDSIGDAMHADHVQI